MDFRKILKEAWTITQENKYLTIYGFVPAFIGITLGIGYLLYQATLTYYMWFYRGASFTFFDQFNFILDPLRSNHVLLVSIVVIGALFYFSAAIVATMFQGALISSIAKIKQKEKHGFIRGWIDGWHSFFEFFGLHVMLAVFDMRLVFLNGFTSMRDVGAPFFWITFIPMVLHFLLAIFVIVFLAYAQFYIVLEGKGVITAIKKSIRMVVENLRETLLIMMILILVLIQAVVNMLLVFAVPFGAVWLTNQLTAVVNFQLALSLSLLLIVVFFILASSWGGTLLVYTTGVWTLAYLELKKKMDQAEAGITAPLIIVTEEEAPPPTDEDIPPLPDAPPPDLLDDTIIIPELTGQEPENSVQD